MNKISIELEVLDTPNPKCETRPVRPTSKGLYRWDETFDIPIDLAKDMILCVSLLRQPHEASTSKKFINFGRLALGKTRPFEITFELVTNGDQITV